MHFDGLFFFGQLVAQGGPERVRKGMSVILCIVVGFLLECELVASDALFRPTDRYPAGPRPNLGLGRGGLWPER